MKQKLLSKKASMAVSKAIKVITSIVLGSAIMAGLCVTVKKTVLPTATTKVESMFGMTGDIAGGGGGSMGDDINPVIALKRNGTIPEGGTYTVTATGMVLNAGESFPVPTAGDTYEEGDYKYTYGTCIYYEYYPAAYGTEWHVSANKTKARFGEIISEIAGKPITSMFMTFSGCTSLESAPKIPDGVINIQEAFFGCSSLISAPTIPNSVKNMSLTFQDCTSLNVAPAIPSGVTDMQLTFSGCTSLTSAPVVPNGVKNMDSTFYGCSSLTGTIEINANPTQYGGCIYGTQITSVTGSCSQEIKNTMLEERDCYF